MSGWCYYPNVKLPTQVTSAYPHPYPSMMFTLPPPPTTISGTTPQYRKKRKPSKYSPKSTSPPVNNNSSTDSQSVVTTTTAAAVSSENLNSAQASSSPKEVTSIPCNYRRHYCAIDIETGGPKVGQHPLLRIGVALVDENAVTIEKQVFPIPFDRTKFDPNTLRDFWQNEEKRPGISLLLDRFEMQSKSVFDEAINKKHPNPIAYALQKFIDYFDDLHCRFAEVVLVGDFIEFDYCVLNYYLSVHLNRPPINYYSRRSKYPVRSHSTSTFYHTICTLLGSEWESSVTESTTMLSLRDSNSNAGSVSPPDRTCFSTALHRMILKPSYQCIASMPSGRQKALAILNVNPYAIAHTELKHDHNPENDAEEIAVIYVLARRAWANMAQRIQPTIQNEIVSLLV